jgi:hypothetical protein
MQFNQVNKSSTTDKAVAICLATFSMFVVGYSATRAFLGDGTTSSISSPPPENIIPHQAQMWSDLGKAN